MKNIIFIGHNVQTLEELKKLCPIKYTIVEDNEYRNKNIILFCEENNIKYHKVKDNEEIFNIIKNDNIDFALMFGFGIILKQNVINHIKQIVNIHNGNLRYNRGPQPLIQAILQKRLYMTLTAHFVESEQIDKGKIITEVNLPINYNLSYHQNNDALVSFIPSIVNNIYNAFKNDCLEGFNFTTEEGSYKSYIPSNEAKQILTIKKLSDL